MTLGNQYDYWNSVADTKTFTHPVNIPLLSQYVNKDAAILDYGCGYGRLVQVLMDNGFNSVTGYDTSRELIGRGNRNCIQNIFFIHNPADLPVENNSIDCILLFAVLTCIPPNKAQQELIDVLHRKLKPGGILYISDYYLQENSTEMERYEFLNDDPENYGVFTLPEGVTFRHHSRKWILNLLAPFRIKEEMHIEVKTMNGSAAAAFQIIAQKH